MNIADPVTALEPEFLFDGLAVSSRAIDRFAFAHDASHYLLIPDAVLTPTSAADVAGIFCASHSSGRPITFRSGGTSLSGQGVSASLLVDTRRNFRRIRILDDGARVQVQPGATVRQTNARLARFGRKLGPDPASEIACTIGGVVANNSSGMACGIDQNTYRTLESMRFVLPSGTVIDTADPDADSLLETAEPELYAGLVELRERIRGNRASVDEIRRQYSMKNTMGYGINSFLDHDEPVQILAHLMIGSEGTLGFVAEATFRTVEIGSHAATGLMIFGDLTQATAALPQLVECGFATIELMDARSLAVAQRQADCPQEIAALQLGSQAAFLVEFQAESEAELAKKLASSEAALASIRLEHPLVLTSEASVRAALWYVRKGLYTAIAGSRPSGTTALLEDIAVPVHKLLITCQELTRLFDLHGYEGSVIFGHAKDGNIHFMLNEDFDSPERLARYQRFTEDLVELVLGQGGSLKAEHGTGRIMAPFVQRQYGEALYEVMREIKRLCDPSKLLNPGVLLSDDPTSHLHDLKVVPTVESEVDRCVECGYCEQACPSRDLTLTPRQRIVVRREMRVAELAGDDSLRAALEADYGYDGVDTCAVDGMCAVACPVDINTGDLVRRLRAESRGPVHRAIGRAAASAWAPFTVAGSVALSTAKVVPTPLVVGATRLGRAALGADNVPLYDGGLPAGGARRGAGESRRAADESRRGAGESRRAADGARRGAADGSLRAAGNTSQPESAKQSPEPAEKTPGAPDALTSAPAPSAELDAVFFPSCVGTMFGPAEHSLGSSGAFTALCERAGIAIVIPHAIEGSCCGTPWKSKGYLDGYRHMTERVLPALLESSDGGRLPIVCDAVSCTEGLETMRELAGRTGGAFSALRFVDSVEFVRQRMLPSLTLTAPVPSIAIHHTCSSTSLGTNDAMTALAEFMSDDVVVPMDWGCCAFAGDRGLLHPELTASATAGESAELAGREFAAYVSANRTCELGMSRATGHSYRHLIEVLEEATRP